MNAMMGCLRSFLLSALHLEGEADLVSALVEVLAIYQRGQGHRHPLPHLLGVAQTCQHGFDANTFTIKWAQQG